MARHKSLFLISLVAVCVLSMRWQSALAGECAGEAPSAPNKVMGGPPSQGGFQPSSLLKLATKNGQLKFGSYEFNGWGLAWGANDKTIIVSDPGFRQSCARIFKIDLIQSETTLLDTNGTNPVISPNGRLVAYQHSSGNIRIVQTNDAKLIVELRNYPKTANANPYYKRSRYAWSRDGRRFAYIRILEAKKVDDYSETLPRSAEIRAYDTETRGDKSVLTSDKMIQALAFGHRDRLYFLQNNGFAPDKWNTSGPEVTIAYLDETSTAPHIVVGNGVSVGTSGSDFTISTTNQFIGLKHGPNRLEDYMILRYERAVFDTESMSYRNFARAAYSGFGPIRLSRNEKLAYFLCKPAAFHNVLCVNSIMSGNTTELPLEALANIGDFAFSPDEQYIAWMSRDVVDTVRIRVARADGSDTRTIYEEERTELSGMALGQVSEIRWRSFDGLELAGLLVLPVDYDGISRVPLIVDIHGGPLGGVPADGSLLNASPLEWQMWAAKGYAVFVSDYRRGQISRRDLGVLTRQPGMIEGQEDVLDVLAGVERVIDLGIADPERLAVIGHSFGSTRLNTLLTMTDRFAVAISKEGTSNNRAVMTINESDMPFAYPGLLTRYRAKRETLAWYIEQASPIDMAYKIKTPLLVVGGEFSQGDPARVFAETINATGGSAEPLVLEDDYHVIRKPANVNKLLSTSIDWIDFWLRGEEDPDKLKVAQYRRWHELRKIQQAREAATDEARDRVDVMEKYNKLVEQLRKKPDLE